MTQLDVFKGVRRAVFEAEGLSWGWYSFDQSIFCALGTYLTQEGVAPASLSYVALRDTLVAKGFVYSASSDRLYTSIATENDRVVNETDVERRLRMLAWLDEKIARLEALGEPEPPVAQEREPVTV